MSEIMYVIIPSYNEESMIKKTYFTINSLLKKAKIKHKFVFVDDGSKDLTWDIIENISKENNNVIGVRFSRNFGKEAAIYAGLTEARNCSCCVVIDCDLQHPPEKIIDMYKLWINGYEIIEGVKASRGSESKFNALGAKIFYQIMSNATKMDMKRASDFKLLDHKAVITLLNLKEKNTFFRALSSWIGFKKTQIEFDVVERKKGESKWSIKSLIKYAINNIASFSAIPLQFVTVLGIITMILSFVLGITTMLQKMSNAAIAGFTTVILLQLIFSSIIMISLGIIGYYIEKIYEEVKGRPRFIISEKCGEISVE